MPEVRPDDLKQAVESQHGGTATFVQAVPVYETHKGQVVWDGVVHVFDLRDQPDGHFRAYAWSEERESGNCQFFALLHGGQIKGPREAVAAAIVGEARSRQ